jgi:hypothetical protein
MTVLQEATEAILDLHALTRGFGTGSPPDPSSVLGYQSNLVRLHMELGQEMARKFGTKESAYLSRKIAEAKEYKNGRINLKKTGGDSTQDALLAVGEEFNREIESATEFEQYRNMIRSMQNAIDFARTTISYIKSGEKS